MRMHIVLTILATVKQPVLLPHAPVPCAEYQISGRKINTCASGFSTQSSGAMIFTGNSDGTVVKWNQGRKEFTTQMHNGAIHGLSLSPNMTAGACCGNDMRITLFPTKPGCAPKRVSSKCHSSAVRSVQFASNGMTLVSAGNDKAVKLWALVNTRIDFLSSLIGHTNWVLCASAKDNGLFMPESIVSCGMDQTVRLWDVPKQSIVATYKDHSTGVIECAFAPPASSANLIVSCGEDGSINLWDSRESALVQHYSAHQSTVNTVSFHSSGNFLLSSSDDSTVRVWDIKAGRLLWVMRAHACSVTCARFVDNGGVNMSRNHSFMVSSGADGNAPKEYRVGDNVELKVTKLTSDIFQIPYDYYYLSYCPSESGDSNSEPDESLGQVLLGDSVVKTPYEMKMRQDEKCRVVCRRNISHEDFEKFAYLIDGKYVINWSVDSLPAAIRDTYNIANVENADSLSEDNWLEGFPIGYKLDDKYYVNNHASFVVKYHVPEQQDHGYRVVGVDVEPRSVTVIESPEDARRGTCDDLVKYTTPMELNSDSQSILFTYDIRWEKSEISWASRWDVYMKIKESKIHWFSILNSLLIVFLLTGLIALVLLRTLRQDIARYNSIIMDEESSALNDIVSEETGWKLVHGDVFRKPKHSKLLAVFIGSGIHIALMLLVSLALAAIGLVSATNRGSYIQIMLLLFTFMGSIAGYVSARIYKMFKGEDWKTTTFLSSFVFPGVAFVVFFTVNLLLWYVDSSAAVSFSDMAILLLLWVGISIPLVYFGAYRGYSKPAIEYPVRVHHIPRQVPRQPWYTRTLTACLVGGLLPFGAVSTELIFLMGSIWHHQFYYLFGFLFVVFLILIITCAEISMAMTYFQLTNEDYRWWWRSFLTSAFSGVYVFLYSLLYLATKLNLVGLVPTVLYLGYMGLASFSFFLLTGSIGSLASFYFVKTIYGSIKVD